MTEAALYYPYMRIEDENWLKATLLLFDQVQRIVPVLSVPGDSEAIQPYITTGMYEEMPLLAAAPLFEERVVQAQRKLAERIKKDAQAAEFRERFSEDRALRMRSRSDRLGFQMHHRKLDCSLRKVLFDNRLAWKPNEREIFDIEAEYVAMHPTLGEAIMSTLAVACALTNGTHIVGDKRSGRLHEHLLSLNVDEVYDGVIHGNSGILAQKATAHQLFEVVVGLACDTSKIGPRQLVALREDREAIRTLLSALSTHAQSIGAIYEGEKRDQAFQDQAAAILEAWRSDSANMTNFAKRLLGTNLLDPSKDAMTLLIDKADIVTTAVSAGSAIGLLTTSVGAGVAVGLIAHGIKTYAEMRSAENKSVYRYLTAMKKAGVVFRSEIKPVQKGEDAAQENPTMRH